MLFHTLSFALFLPIVFGLFWYLGRNKHKWQLGILLAASYFFYGSWDVRFLSLIILSSAVDYFVGLKLYKAKSNSQKKQWLALSLGINLGILAIFKYFNFFVQSFSELLTFIGFSVSIPSLQIILPVGISFYTFQTLSYTIDIYRGKLVPTKDPLAFFTFVAFFPQLVAGPIERASHLLPQFLSPSAFNSNQATSGLRMILWGLFKKMVIADRLAILVDVIYASPDSYSGSVLLFATLGFAFQIYCDFSGYSDMAIGIARLFGIDLMTNFRTPYFSTSLREFWSRWHISLSTWFRDYLYIPLGGNRLSDWKWARNIMLTFLISGLWHGAKITFVIWGGIHGLAYLSEAMIHKKWRVNGKWMSVVGGTITFGIILLAWVFFRSNNLDDAWIILNNIFSWKETGSMFSSEISPLFGTKREGILFLGSMSILLIGEIFHSRSSFQWNSLPKAIRWSGYYALIGWILLTAVYEQTQQFIYFQF